MDYWRICLSTILANSIWTEIHHTRQAIEGFWSEDKRFEYHTPDQEAFPQNGKVCVFDELLGISIYDLTFRKHAKVDEAGLKFKPAELSHDDIEAAKVEWENMILSDGEDKT